VLSGLAAPTAPAPTTANRRFVHGEVTPGNIVVRDGVARLVPLVKGTGHGRRDLARIRQLHRARRLLGDACGQGADVFSIGVLLWEAEESACSRVAPSRTP
jgi:hypothetical protein